MNRALSIISTAAIIICLSKGVSADTRSAATCAASLTADQKLIYQTVLPDLTHETNLTALVRAKVIALVSAGRLPMSSAPDDAKVAGRCLQMVHQ